MIFTMAVPFLEESIIKSHSIHHAEPFTVGLGLKNIGTSVAGEKIKYQSPDSVILRIGHFCHQSYVKIEYECLDSVTLSAL